MLFVGSLIPRKGVGFLIQAAKRVVKNNPEVLFIIVGSGPLRGRLLSDVAAASLGHNFVFIHGLSEQDLPAAYRCADVFAFPSIQEGQGIVLLEAQSSAKPVVAFNVSGIAETVRNGETGLLVEPGSDEMAEAIMRLLSDAPLRAQMGTRGREFVRNNFSWDLCASRMLGVYREAMAAN